MDGGYFNFITIITILITISLIIVEVYLSIMNTTWDGAQLLSSRSNSRCYDRIEDISKELEGKWLKDSQSKIATYPGHFGRTENRTLWEILACPAEMALFSCYLNTYLEGANAEISRWQSSSCILDSFRPVSFLELLRNKRLMFCGDSLQMQFFQSIICSVHGTGIQEYNLSWINISHIYGPNLFHLDRDIVNSVYYPAYNATILLYIPPVHEHHYETNFLLQYIELGQLTLNDVLVVNFGVGLKNIESAVLSLAKQHSELESTNRPWLIWREVSIQHFQNTNKSVPLGYYNGSNNNLPCLTRIDRNRAYEEDYRNRFAERVMLQHNITILRTSTALYDAMNMHSTKQWQVGSSRFYDCTHYCMPSGVFYHWRDLLFNALRVRMNAL